MEPIIFKNAAREVIHRRDHPHARVRRIGKHLQHTRQVLRRPAGNADSLEPDRVCRLVESRQPAGKLAPERLVTDVGAVGEPGVQDGRVGEGGGGRGLDLCGGE